MEQMPPEPGDLDYNRGINRQRSNDSVSSDVSSDDGSTDGTDGMMRPAANTLSGPSYGVGANAGERHSHIHMYMHSHIHMYMHSHIHMYMHLHFSQILLLFMKC